MKLYACRALDYLQIAGPDERRYLLFNAVQKARVSTEGVRVIGLLSECIGAKGFESDTFLEMAIREVPLIPSLEGSTHINFQLTAQFVENYFADSSNDAMAPQSVTLNPDDPLENPYWFGRHDRHSKTVQFAGWAAAYKPLRAVPNVQTFVTQVRAFRQFIVGDARPANLPGDAALVDRRGAMFLNHCLCATRCRELRGRQRHAGGCRPDFPRTHPGSVGGSDSSHGEVRDEPFGPDDPETDDPGASRECRGD